MRVRENLSALVTASDRKQTTSSNLKFKVGKVFAVITSENTPNKALYEQFGGSRGLGTIFYLDYDLSKNIDINGFDLTKCSVAKSFFSNNNSYPLIGELVWILQFPSFTTQTSGNTSQKYYIGPINIWNDFQQNSLTTDSLGKTFIENSDLRPLQSFEGDYIIQSRKGSGIRFGTTTKLLSDKNEWSSIGNDGDPITILVNGYVTTDTSSLVPNIEEINKEMSSIYMTSTQKIPLTPGANIINPINSSLPPNKYINSQIILNSDRVTINSKKDEVLLFAKTNIELNTDNIINLNAGEYIHVNSDKILLGTKSDNTVPNEPVLLGDQTVILLEQIITALNTLGSYLSSAVVPTSDGAMAIPAVNDAGVQLLNDMSTACDKLLKITSDKVFTV